MNPHWIGFFQMEYEEALQHFEYIQPYLTRAAEQLGLRELFDKFDVAIEIEGLYEYFHMLTGRLTKPHRPKTVALPYYLFKHILFIDFGRWHTPEELVFYLHSLGAAAEEYLTLICHSWYHVSYFAAEQFFSSQANLRRYLSKFATAWWNSASMTRNEHTRYVQEFSRIAQFCGKDVLEAACGFGRLSQAYQHANSLVRFDLSADMLREAMLHNSSRRTYSCVADLNELPIAHRCFDVVTAMQITMHLTKPFEVLRALGQTLKKSGELWTDFTCTHRELRGHTFFQESFFTRIYDRQYVIDQSLRQGYCLASAPLEIQDRRDHYWLLLHLKARSK